MVWIDSLCSSRGLGCTETMPLLTTLYSHNGLHNTHSTHTHLKCSETTERSICPSWLTPCYHVCESKMITFSWRCLSVP
jgi:hypothetical protein